MHKIRYISIQYHARFCQPEKQICPPLKSHNFSRTREPKKAPLHTCSQSTASNLGGGSSKCAVKRSSIPTLGSNKIKAPFSRQKSTHGQQILPPDRLDLRLKSLPTPVFCTNPTRFTRRRRRRRRLVQTHHSSQREGREEEVIWQIERSKRGRRKRMRKERAFGWREYFSFFLRSYRRGKCENQS